VRPLRLYLDTDEASDVYDHAGWPANRLADIRRARAIRRVAHACLPDVLGPLLPTARNSLVARTLIPPADALAESVLGRIISAV
jgi:hypothetical protein